MTLRLVTIVTLEEGVESQGSQRASFQVHQAVAAGVVKVGLDGKAHLIDTHYIYTYVYVYVWFS